MAEARDQQLVDRFETFYRQYYADEIAALAREYPRERKSLVVDWQDLFRFDPDFADDVVEYPDRFRDAAEEALRLYDLPVDVSLDRAHVRIQNLGELTEIRDIRADHINTLVSVRGIVRKATNVRPKIQEATFVCQRCGAETVVPQTDAGFQDPYQCESCERQGPFQLEAEHSEFVDAQKLRVQESPEGLGGGETPQAVDMNVEDDITGRVTPGDHVVATGILRLDQGKESSDSPIFDVYLEGVSLEIEDEEFEEMDITEADKREIIELSEREDLYEQIVDSIAPAIYGYEQAKLAMALQLFSGVTKHLPDGTRIRGDLHMLLIGDPGTGKSQLLQYIRHIAPRSVYTSGKGSSSAGLCVTGDTMVHTGDGFRKIATVAEEYHPSPVGEETAIRGNEPIYTYDSGDGDVKLAETSHVWRMPEKECNRIETSHGKSLEASKNTPVLTWRAGGFEWRDISDLEAGDYVAVPRYSSLNRTSPSVRTYLELTNEKIKPSDESVAFLRSRLRDRFGTLRDAAAELGLSEDFIYDSLSNRHLPLEKLDRILDAIDAERSDVEIDRVMARHGHSITIPDTFDEDLLYLLGLVFGDGDVMVSRRGGNRGLVRISNSDEALLERAIDSIERLFDKSVQIEYEEDRVPSIRLHSATVARLFRNLGVESPKDDLSLPPEITTAEHADAFLRGLFDADGSVSARDGGGSSIQFSTICGDLARQVQLMLETYGVRARLRERDRRGTNELESGYVIESKSVQHHLAMYGVQIDRFADAIGFESTAKQAALETVVEDARRRGDTLPVGETLVRADGIGGRFYQNMEREDNPSRERTAAILSELDLGDTEPLLREAVEADLNWERVVTTEETGKKEVFDLTVPGTNNFLGNGVVTHNTAAAVRDDFGDGQQWTLEAGALVLADQGIAAVDELDKMRCVSDETLVSLGDGRIKRIGEIARDAVDEGDIEPLENGRTIRDIDDMTVKTMTEDGSVIERPVTAIHEYDAPDDLYEVALETGETLTSTADHPYFVFESGDRGEKSAENLESGDWVYVPDASEMAWSDGSGVVETGVSGSKDTTVRDESTALASVLGYLSGDGNVYYSRDEGSYGIRFTNSEPELLDHFEEVVRRAFDTEPVRHPSERRDDGVETVRVHGKTVADAVLDAGMNLEIYDGKSFPTKITEYGREAKAAFVRAVADSEGSVDSTTGNVKVYSSSYELLTGLKEVLREFGVSSQIQTRSRSEGRDLYVLAITDATSLRNFRRHIGFTLARKQSAIEAVADAADGSRTIRDVIPDISDRLKNTRSQLRLHQSECGTTAYGDFERGTANTSIHRSGKILAAFEERKQSAIEDLEKLTSNASWDTVNDIAKRYHISQRDLAHGTDWSQQQVSKLWENSEDLRRMAIDRLRSICKDVASTDLAWFRSLVTGDVKWRRVESVETVQSSESFDDQIPQLIDSLAEEIGCTPGKAERKARELLSENVAISDLEDIRSTLDKYRISQRKVAEKVEVNPSTISRWINGVVRSNNIDGVIEVTDNLVGKKRKRIAEKLEEIEERRKSKVYDLTVKGTHNFVANGMIVHNSEDRSAMHEALEQQSISISKAGINATLKARCSLLGAANPKYGRFDQYEPIGEQIDLEPALISRFDLIFTVTDQPDPERDADLADHILQTNYAGELNTHRNNVTTSNVSDEEVEGATDTVEPAIEADLLRKYVAYARRNTFPTMTPEARSTIEDFYVDLRSKGQDEDAPVPVTARKLEALVRLSEASARARLSDTIEKRDAERVIEIVRKSLQAVGVDPETDQYDADVIETGTSKTQRDRIKNIRQLIEEIEGDFEEGAPIDEVLARAEEVGMERSKAEHEIDKLKERGEVYEPRTGHLRTT